MQEREQEYHRARARIFGEGQGPHTHPHTHPGVGGYPIAPGGPSGQGLPSPRAGGGGGSGGGGPMNGGGPGGGAAAAGGGMMAGGGGMGSPFAGMMGPMGGNPMAPHSQMAAMAYGPGAAAMVGGRPTAGPAAMQVPYGAYPGAAGPAAAAMAAMGGYSGGAPALYGGSYSGGGPAAAYGGGGGGGPRPTKAQLRNKEADMADPDFRRGRCGCAGCWLGWAGLAWHGIKAGKQQGKGWRAGKGAASAGGRSSCCAFELKLSCCYDWIACTCAGACTASGLSPVLARSRRQPLAACTCAPATAARWVRPPCCCCGAADQLCCCCQACQLVSAALFVDKCARCSLARRLKRGCQF
jgi:hypothetical protein